jgi:hypothetical protein
MGWSGDITPIEWAAKMKDAPREAINIFAFEIFKRVVLKTPVDTGAARQNWLVSINGEDNSVVRTGEKVKKIKARKGENKGKTVEVKSQIWTTAASDVTDLSNEKGRHVMADGGNVIETAKGDDKIFIQNNLPYIAALEFGRPDIKNHVKTTPEGRSLQSPHGMVGIVLAKADILFERAVKAVKNNEQPNETF